LGLERMNDITVLGSGFSSVAGFDWFLVGYHSQDVFVVTCDHTTGEIEGTRKASALYRSYKEKAGA
jgi:hypothetical protein